MTRLDFEKRISALRSVHEELIGRKNPAADSNGVWTRYTYPILTAAHTPLFWRYDLNPATNPFLLERFGINGTFNAGAIKFDGKYVLVVRVEGNDRKSFFALAESDNGIDGFRFRDRPLTIPPADGDETNLYDMRLTAHEDGWIYGVFCAERHDPSAAPGDLSSAVATAGVARTKDLVHWERLPDIKSPTQQRNVVLHPEFVDGKYALYTRPQEGFIAAGALGGGIGWALVDDMTRAEIRDEKIIDVRFYHTIKEVKNGDTVRDLEAGLGYEMSAEILYMPEWMQKLKDAGRIKFYFFGRLCNPGIQVGYEDAYLYDFYVDRIGKHHIEFYWVCKSASDPDNDTFRFTGLLKDYELTDAGTLYYERLYFDVQMDKKISGKRVLGKVKLLQAGGEFTEATSATHKISMHSDTLAECYHIPWNGIPSEWTYWSGSDAYTMEFCIKPRHGYEFLKAVATADNAVTLNVQNTKVTNRKLVNSGSDQNLYIDLVAKRRLTDVRGTLKNFRLGTDAGFTELVSNEPKKYTFKNTVVYDVAYGSYGVEAGQLREGDTCYVYFDVEPGFGYYLPENASVKVILPAGYRANGIFDNAETYSTVYKGDWYSHSDILRKYRTSRLLEPNSEGKVYGTDIRIQEPKAGERPAAFADYAEPTSLPYNMKVLSMQWRKTDQAHTPMGKYDKFKIGESYFLDLRIGFEGGEEKGYVYPKNYREFKVNGKSVNQWMEYDDNTNGHFLRVYESYKLVDPSASGTLTGTVKSFNSTTDPVTVQLFKSGSSAAAYSTTVRGNSASYTISGVASGTYTMKVSKKNHVTRAYSVTVSTGTKTQNAQIHLLGDINGDGRINTSDVGKANMHAKNRKLLTGYEFACADINGDGRINTSDVGKINMHAKNKKRLW